MNTRGHDTKKLSIGRSKDSGLVLEHQSVSRKHASLNNISPGKWELIDFYSTKGTFVNNTQIRRRILNDGDLVRFGRSSPYVFTQDKLTPYPDRVGVSLDFQGIGVRIEGKDILRDLSFSIEADEFVAIVGPSGCGKTTLLSLLTSDLLPVSGKILWDRGRDLIAAKTSFRATVGVVPQEDLVYSELTVFENLRYAARIRCQNLGRKERIKRINSAIEKVELEGHQGKIVDLLSGGQRKRLNVAIELLRHPGFSFLMSQPVALTRTLHPTFGPAQGPQSPRGDCCSSGAQQPVRIL